MPIYEFYSPDTHRIYSFFARSLADAGRTPLCPDDPGARMERRVSGFAVTASSRKSENEDVGQRDLDDPRMEAAMAQLEHEMAGIDEENPDPRQLGHLMRRMSDLTGEKLPADMEEMVRRLELGEDPESLEEEYGDLLDDEGMLGGMDAEGDTTDGNVRAWLRRRRQPERDPQLYEMSDYLGPK